MTETPPVISAARLSGLSGVRHGFFTRRGGVSTGLYNSLNCGPGSEDDLANVRENQARAATALGAQPDALVTAHQIHSADVQVVSDPWPMTERPRVDALVTDQPGIALGILTADCAPVLFADAEAGVIGAAHAGWRGALGGVIDATTEAMQKLGAKSERIAAVVGPCIGHISYEVGPEFPEAFFAEDPRNEVFFAPAPRDGHFMFALPGYVVSKLARAGVRAAHALNHDTCAEDETFFSYRRTTHNGQKHYGRNLSAIMLRGK